MIHHGLRYANQDNWQPICGYAQSPIHIKSHEASKMEDQGVILPYHKIHCTHIMLEQTTILVKANAQMTINGRIFHLIQFHFHSPAEHVIDDQNFDLELHLVHRSQSGRLAVLAIMIQVGEFNSLFDFIMKQAEKENYEQQIDIRSLFPEKLHYFHYLGSLTTPPLTENVEWYVFSHPITIAPEQVKAFRRLYHETARKIQPTNQRPILYHEEKN